VALRLAVVCAPGHTRFIEDTAASLDPDIEVATCFSIDPAEVRAAVAAAHTVWLEWADELTIEVTNKLADLLADRRVIVRLHSYELFAGLAAAVRWEVVDDVVFVGAHIRELARQLCPALFEQVEQIHVIPNGIDLDRFPLAEPRPHGKSLAFVANLSFKKGPMLLLHAFRALVDADPGFRLFLAGRVDQPRYAFYIDHLVHLWGLEEHVRHDGYIDDIGAWLTDKDFIVCTSPIRGVSPRRNTGIRGVSPQRNTGIEGQGLGILEGAARGLRPLVHHFVGAEQVYPKSWLWGSIDEFVAMAQRGRGEGVEYPAVVEGRHDKDAELSATRAMMRVPALG